MCTLLGFLPGCVASHLFSEPQSWVHIIHLCFSGVKENTLPPECFTRSCVCASVSGATFHSSTIIHFSYYHLEKKKILENFLFLLLKEIANVPFQSVWPAFPIFGGFDIIREFTHGFFLFHSKREWQNTFSWRSAQWTWNEVSHHLLPAYLCADVQCIYNLCWYPWNNLSKFSSSWLVCDSLSWYDWVSCFFNPFISIGRC